MTVFKPVFLILSCLVLLAPSPSMSLFGQEDQQDGQETQEQKDARFYHPEQMKLWAKYYAAMANEVEATVVDVQDEYQLKPGDEPIMSWRNPASKAGTHGVVYSWNDDGYPMILGAFWSKEIRDNRYVMLEAHSLADQSMTFKNDRVFWKPANAADERVAIPKFGGDIPDSAEMRLGELESMISRMAVSSDRNDSDESVELRIDETLVYRFSSNKYNVVDGGMFVAYYNNDPELFFVFEAVEHDGNQQWFVRFIRHTNQLLDVTYDGNSFWNYQPKEGDTSFGGADQPTYSVTLESLPPELTEDDIED